LRPRLGEEGFQVFPHELVNNLVLGMAAHLVALAGQVVAIVDAPPEIGGRAGRSP
jgi:hypothetical protein